MPFGKWWGNVGAVKAPVVDKAFYDSLVTDLPEAAKKAEERMRRVVAEREKALELRAERDARREILEGLAKLDEVINEANDVARAARIDETCETILDEILRDSTGER